MLLVCGVQGWSRYLGSSVRPQEALAVPNAVGSGLALILNPTP